VTESELDAINAEASVLMKRGIALLDEPRREAAIDALHCFDEALELRRRVPVGHSAFQDYLLAACLLNRADALVRFNDAGPLAAALASYQEGIDVLQAVPLSEDARYPRRLAIAHQNRGLALQLRGDPADAASAFTEALAVLDNAYSADIPDRDYLRGVVWLNLANLQAADPAVASQLAARAAAARTLSYVAGTEGEDIQAAAAGLQARHIVCRICAQTLTQIDEIGDDMPSDVHEASDAVDEGLRLIRNWEMRGITAFRGLAFDLFRFGARVYARFQPQFLDEFIAENVDPSQSSPGYVESSDMVLAAHEARQLRSQ
jgi:tetratricopeptide (TPR) repeat protein